MGPDRSDYEHPHPHMRCNGMTKGETQCRRYGTTYRGALFLCRQHARLHDEHEAPTPSQPGEEK